MITKKKSKPKIFRRVLLLLVIIIFYQIFLSPIKINKSITINQWDTFSVFLKDLSSIQKNRVKLYAKLNHKNISDLDIWNYTFEGKYSPKEFVNIILKWPKQDFLVYTVLEWRSIYDIDSDLTKKWHISAGQYISYVSDYTFIHQLNYEFLDEKMYIAKALPSLEWFLYPDTYYLIKWKDVIPQLVKAQLDWFNSKIWKKYKPEIDSKINQADSQMSFYQRLTLASIVEKEERNNANKPTVAWILLTRFLTRIMLGADITLCYGYKIPYEKCTPAVIWSKIYDDSNIFNTRRKFWLPPQPISNPSTETFASTINYKKTDYLFYLHDNQWKIHYAVDLAWHNQNKSTYLGN